MKPRKSEHIEESSKQSFTTRLSNNYDYYINNEIGDASDYSDWFHQIRNANEQDTITIHINSPGGDLFTTIQFLMALSESQAHIIASVEGMCMSAATLIFLMCDEFRISPYSMFMFHNYSGMTHGKGGEMFDTLVHERKWSENLFTKLYTNFMTQSEIKSLLDNKDIWMDTEEVIKRLKTRIELNNKTKPKKK